VNILIGENAQGKTNALEAIYLLAVGKSHRTHRDTDLIMHGQDRASIWAVVEMGGRDRTLQLDLGAGGKRALVNGVHLSKMTDFLGHFQAVLFAPEDLQLVKGGPGVRRRFVDMELGQTQVKYLYHLSHYTRALQQRNSLLKKGDVDDAYLEVFDEQLIQHGTEVLQRRLRFIDEMRTLADEIYQSIAHHRERFGLAYHTSIPGLDPAVMTDKQVIADRFRAALASRRQADRQLGYTTVGPHRDDIRLFLDDQPVQSFASQGQQRTIALSLRLAEIEFIRREVGEYPVLLLDDVLSELDDTRQRNLVWSMSEKVQTILTTTSLFQLTGRLQETARLFSVCSGIIQSEG
jgi:DNA replication and repair protein RecF